jgi:LppX_LprAFG lipoprotein
MRRVLFAFVVLPLALAACSGTEARVASRLTPKGSVQQAANKTAGATSEHVTLNASGSAGMLSGSVTGSGDFDNANRRGSFHLDVSGYGSLDAIFDGTSAYVRAPFLAPFLRAGKTWLKLSGKAARLDVLPKDPRQALARLKKLANVREVGHETVDGVSTTHYRGTGRLGRGTLDVWIGDDDGYVRRIQAAAAGRNGKGNVTVAFSDFGEAVTVTVPPVSDTVDGTSLIPYLGRG